MLAVLRGARSLFSVLLVGVAWVILTPFLRLVIIPAAWILPARRLALVSFYMKLISHVTFGILRIGGARFRREGVLPTGSPVAIVANHQAILDIMQITLLGRPHAPAFIARTRYRRWVPHVSACMRMLHCPLIDPRRDRVGAVKTIRRAAQERPNGIVIFPEGHRTRDGEVRPFHTVGVEALLRAKRVPVYIVVTDGLWKARRFVDNLFQIHWIDAWSAVYGPYEIPEDEDDVPAFVERLRTEIVSRLTEHRSARDDVRAA
jgi:1-acyl-sn-glycerol-3-phosphate acyltransferase